MKKTSQARKIREHRGTGTGVNYKPWIYTGEFGSKGTTSNPIDWKTGRQIQLLSQGETIVWYLLRWDDNNLDIREQFPLELEQTMQIAKNYGIKHPADRQGNPIVMTTDFLVTRVNGEIALSVKNSLEGFKSKKRLIEKAYIEKMYWETHGVPFRLLTKEEMNQAMADNIRNVVAFYDAEYLPDEISLLKKLISRKLISVDMTKPLNFRDLLHKYRGELRRWLK